MSTWYLVKDGYAAGQDATSLVRRVLLEGVLDFQGGDEHGRDQGICAQPLEQSSSCFARP